MANNIYEIFNELSLNEEVFSSVNDSLTDLEKKKIKIHAKKRVHKSRNKYIKAAAVSLICISVVGTLIVKPAFADAIIEKSPFLDSVYEKLGYYNNYKDFSQYVGISKESDGYKFTIDKLIADEDTVLVGIRIYKKGMNQKYEANTFMMTADVSSFYKHIINSGSSNEIKLDEDNTLVLLENDASPNKKLPKRFDMKVNIHHMFDGKANVNFDLNVSRDKIDDETMIKKNLGKTSITSDYTVKFDQIKASPINTKVTYSYNGKLNSDEYIELYAYDDKGQIYNWSSSNGHNGYTSTRFNTVAKDIKKLYLVPYILKSGNMLSDAEYKALDFYEKNYTLDVKRLFNFGKPGQVDVYNVERTGSTIKIYYSLKGDLSKVAGYTPVWLEVKNTSQDNMTSENHINYNNIRKYKLNASDNYCLEYYDLNSRLEYTYKVNIPGNKTIYGKPLEVNLK